MRLLGRISAGLILWAFGFSLLYALQGAGCAGGWHEVPLWGGSALRWILISTWLLLVVTIVTLLPLARAAPSTFEKRVTLATTLFAAMAMLATGTPAVLASTCA